MKYVHIYVRTNIVGSESCCGSTELTRDEWDALTDKEQNEIANEMIWNVIDVWEKDE